MYYIIYKYILALPTTNEDVYKQLYKFDANTELDEFKFTQNEMDSSNVINNKQ